MNNNRRKTVTENEEAYVFDTLWEYIIMKYYGNYEDNSSGHVLSQEKQ